MSTLGGSDAESVPTQLANGERHAERRGWVVAGRFKDDGFSAFKEIQRDDFVRLVSAIEAGQLDVVIGDCIEVASADVIMVRDTTDRGGVVLTVSVKAWQAFTALIAAAPSQY